MLHYVSFRDRTLITTGTPTRHVATVRTGNPASFEPEWRPERVWCVSNANGTIITRRNGVVLVMGQSSVLTEGTDLPRCSCVVLARPTRSWSLFVQQVGRAMRLFDGQTEALILDLAGATHDHSLVAAPALIGGSRCPQSPSGEHLYRPMAEGRARCAHCKATLPCFAALVATEGASGQHDYVEGNCKHCARPQCPEGPENLHHWVRQAGHKRQCLFCGREIHDPGLKPGGREGERIAAGVAASTPAHTPGGGVRSR